MPAAKTRKTNAHPIVYADGHTEDWPVMAFSPSILTGVRAVLRGDEFF